MKHKPIVLACLTVAALIVGLVWPNRAPGEDRQAVAVAGDRFAARLQQVSDDWLITFQTPTVPDEDNDADAAATVRTLDAAALVRWGTPAESSRGAQIIFSDGGLLIAEVVRADVDHLVADSFEFGELEIPLELVSGILFHPPGTRAGRDRLIDSLSGGERDSDVLLLINGDRLPGTVLNIDENEIHLQAEVGELAIARGRVRGLAFNSALFARPVLDGLASVVGWRDGSRLVATSLVVSENVQLKSAGELTFTSENPSNIVYLQPSGGQSVYLSDRKPDSYRHVPFLNLTWPYHLDRNAQGGCLRSRGRLYLKGIGMHSAARLTFRLDGKYRRFDAGAALDDGVKTAGSVTYRVFVDGKERYASDIVRGGAEPLNISVPVVGARRMSLIINFADRGDEQDHANWLDARLVR